jgi:ATP-binding cassette subfamily B protein
VLVALRYYGREPARLLPALGNVGLNCIAPLLAPKLVGRISGDPGIGVGTTLPYVLGFAGAMLPATASSACT